MATAHRVLLMVQLATVPALAVVVLAIAGVVQVEPLILVATLLLMVGLLVNGFRLSSGPLARGIARLPVGIRWKIVAALSAIGALVLFSVVVNIEAMNHMHERLHEIQELGRGGPALALDAVDELERTQHGPAFELIPLLAVLGLLAALALGIALARSVLEALGSIEAGMRRIGDGDFSQPIDTENRDEFGRLASQINGAAGQLKLAQEATLAAERARALRDRIAQVTRAQEEERRRISRELHDDLGPSLAAAANRLRTSRMLVRTDPLQVEQDLNEVAEDLTAQIRGIRKLIYDLRPLVLDQLGLAGTLRQHVETFSRERGLTVSFTAVDGMQIHPLAEMTVLRVVQEALSNVYQHAGATRALVELRPAGRFLEATVEDDGRGFDVDGALTARTGQGIGLRSMQERAELVGGRIAIASRPGKGCRVTLHIPLEEAGVGANTIAAGR